MVKKGDIAGLIGISIITFIFCILYLKSMEYSNKPNTQEITTQAVTEQTTEVQTETETETQTQTETETETETESKTLLGYFRATAYCECEKCCGVWASKREDGKVVGASGKELIPNYSIAVDTKVIPMGTKVYINGKEYIAQDTGGAIKGNRIDIYMSTHQEALNWGVQYVAIYK